MKQVISIVGLKSIVHISYIKNYQKQNLNYNNFLLIDIDECASNPCQNGGSCVDGINLYTCNCNAGYAGYNCEIGNCTYTITLT